MIFFFYLFIFHTTTHSFHPQVGQNVPICFEVLAAVTDNLAAIWSQPAAPATPCQSVHEQTAALLQVC